MQFLTIDSGPASINQPEYESFHSNLHRHLIQGVQEFLLAWMTREPILFKIPNFWISFNPILHGGDQNNPPD